MIAPEKTTPPKEKTLAAPAHPARAARDEDLEETWFAQPASGAGPVARPRSTPPTGDAEVDSWLK